MRNTYRRNAVTGSEIGEEEPEAPPETFRGLEYESLELALQELGPPEEEVVRLKHFRHMVFDQIAKQLQVSPNTVKTRYYRGLSWLRRHLKKSGTWEEYS